MELGLTVRKIVACAGFDANDKTLHDLKFDSSTAKLLREEFAKILDERRPQIYTFQEAVGLTGFGSISGKVRVNSISFVSINLTFLKVVEDSSSALEYGSEQKDYLGANHVNMCRFSDSEDDGYEKVKAGLSRCLEMERCKVQPGVLLERRSHTLIV